MVNAFLSTKGTPYHDSTPDTTVMDDTKVIFLHGSGRSELLPSPDGTDFLATEFGSLRIKSEDSVWMGSVLKPTAHDDTSWITLSKSIENTSKHPERPMGPPSDKVDSMTAPSKSNLRQRMKQPERPKSEQLDNIDLFIAQPTKSNLKQPLKQPEESTPQESDYQGLWEYAKNTEHMSSSEWGVNGSRGGVTFKPGPPLASSPRSSTPPPPVSLIDLDVDIGMSTTALPVRSASPFVASAMPSAQQTWFAPVVGSSAALAQGSSGDISSKNIAPPLPSRSPQLDHIPSDFASGDPMDKDVDVDDLAHFTKYKLDAMSESELAEHRRSEDLQRMREGFKLLDAASNSGMDPGHIIRYYFPSHLQSEIAEGYIAVHRSSIMSHVRGTSPHPVVHVPDNDNPTETRNNSSIEPQPPSASTSRRSPGAARASGSVISISSNEIIPEKRHKKYHHPYQDDILYWWISSSKTNILCPPADVPEFVPDIADLYIHTNLAEVTEQAWIYQKNRAGKLAWENITESWRTNTKNIRHPDPSEGRDRVLTKQGKAPYWSLVTQRK